MAAAAQFGRPQRNFLTARALPPVTCAQVDYRVMLSFLEFYEALLTFINFKLYHTEGLVYPPPRDATADASGAHLAAIVLKAAPTAAPRSPPPPRGARARRLPPPPRSSRAQLAAAGGRAEGAAAAEGRRRERRRRRGGGGGGRREPRRTRRRCGRGRRVGGGAAASPADTDEASAFGADDARVTHVVVDRPAVAAPLPSREYVQPQWVYDCLNARALLPVHGYAPGKHCPPHLSPFRDGGEGYVPAERVRAALQEARAAEEGGGGADDDEAYGDEDDEEDEDDGEDDEDDEEDEEDEGTKRRRPRRRWRGSGVSYNPNEKSAAAPRAAAAVAAARMPPRLYTCTA